MATPSPVDPPPRRPDLPSCLFIGVGHLLMTALILRHPTHHGTSTQGAASGIAESAASLRLVHGCLLALLVLVFIGFVGMSGCLGWRLGRVRAGAVLYGVAVACMLVAALVDGFVVPGLAERYSSRPDTDWEALRPAFALCGSMIRAFASAGSLALAAAAFSWSWALMGRGTPALVVGVLGMVVGALTAVGLVSGHLRLTAHGMATVVATQTVWAVCLSGWLLRVRSRASAGTA